MEMTSAIRQLLEGRDFSREAMRDVMRQIMTGEATAAQIGGFLIGLRLKGETVAEIAGAAEVMRELAKRVDLDDVDHLVDTCGTGGDGSRIFNVSTAAAFVVAAGGGKVAKHGNRSVSSKSGSADLLEAAGVELNLTPEQIARCVREVGVGFMFAPMHHSAMRHAIGPRKELGARTVFNLLGPLTNPATPRHQVVGVYHRDWLRPVAEVLRTLGSEHVLVVHAEDGLDEISIAAPTHVVELVGGEIAEYRITPEDFGLTTTPLDELVVNDAADSLNLVKAALGKKGGLAGDMVALNAGAALFACNIADSLQEGVVLAQDIIGGGTAREKLQELVAFTGCLVAVEND